MHYRIFSILTAFICLFGCVLTSAAQDANGTDNDAAKPVYSLFREHPRSMKCRN